jgi:thiol:disulfide interchange protein DsbA
MTVKTKKHINYVLIALTLLGMTGCKFPHKNLNKQSSFQAGKDYRLISTSDIIPKATPQEEVKVIEFFGYDCPACYEIDTPLHEWVNKQPDFVKFEQIPVSDDDPTLKALDRLYYLTRMLGHHVPPLIFKLIYEEGQDVSNPEIAKQNLIKKGISLSDYEAANRFQAGIDSQIIRGKRLVQTYNIEATPVFIIGGRYETNLKMTDGDLARLFDVMDMLIEKVRKGEN